MDDEMINALAAGVAPFVRECVADVADNLTLRVCDLEMLAEKTVMLPPELAEQVASAARLLHELPPIERGVPSTRVTRIERDEHGAFVPIYGETQP